MNQECTVMIPSRRPNLAKQCKSTLNYIENIFIVDTSAIKSFSKALNTCVQKSPTEIVIVCNDLVRPNTINFDKILNYLNRGFGFVALFDYYFFGFKKEFLRTIGFFDERYIGDYCEGLDLEFRCKESNIAFYKSIKEAPFLNFFYNKNDTTHLNNKWDYRYPTSGNNRSIVEHVTRKLKEEDYSYDLGMNQDVNFLKFNNSVSI